VNILKGIAAFTGWLTGALAGVGAILYAFGYLITRAHLSFLGVYGLFDQNNVYFIQEGAMFVLVIGELIARTLLPLLVTLGVAALLIGGIAFMLTRYLARSAPGLAERGNQWKGSLVRWREHALLTRSVYVALLMLFLFHADTYLFAFNYPLLISNVLYSEPNTTDAVGGTDPKTREIRNWLIEGNEAKAHAYFLNLLWGDVLAGLLLLAVWHITFGWQWRTLWVSWFLVGFMIYSLSLPMTYGVLVRSTKYPVVTLNTTDEKLTRGLGTLFLLNKSDKEFVVWDAQGRQLVWIPESEVKRADIRKVESLFRPGQL
jgi:hypothetical protein